MNRNKSNRVNRMKFPTLKMQWEGRKGAAHTFVGMKQYEEWAMAQSPPMDPQTGEVLPLSEGWMDPEGYSDIFGNVGRPLNEKEILFEQAVAIREQIESAIAVEDYEKADVLQKTLDVIKIKYDKL